MGDIADYYMDSYPADTYGFYIKKPKTSKPTCKYCGTTNVVWIKNELGWRLFNKNSDVQHTCCEYLNKKGK